MPVEGRAEDAPEETPETMELSTAVENPAARFPETGQRTCIAILNFASDAHQPNVVVPPKPLTAGGGQPRGIDGQSAPARRDDSGSH